MAIKPEVPLKPRDAGPLMIFEHALCLQDFGEFEIGLSPLSLIGFLIYTVLKFVLVGVDKEITAWGRGLRRQ